jgi:hypothetical protein
MRFHHTQYPPLTRHPRRGFFFHQPAMEAATRADRVRHLRRIRSAMRSQTSVAVLRRAEDRVWTEISRIQDSDIRRGTQEIFRTAVKTPAAGASADPGRLCEALRDGIGDVINYLDASE